MSNEYWIITGLLIAAALICIAVVRSGTRKDDIDPYNGDGF